MAWLPMYLLDEDVEFLNDWLNQEEEIAFLVSNGHKKWIAKNEHYILTDIATQSFAEGKKFAIPNYAEYNLWHVPSGKLPLLDVNMDGVKLKFSKEDWNEDEKVENPWLGWTELRTGANSRVPYFGAGHPGVIHLEIKLSHDEDIRISNFGWIGNRYKIIGNGAESTTEKFWNKLRRMTKKVATQIPRGNTLDWRKEIFAFPAAYKEIQNGRPCALNP